MSAIKFNDAQSQAIKHPGHCLVMACPGSGKTAVLRERAVRKLQIFPKQRGACVTFTKDAAGELEARVLLAYPEAAGRVEFGTFHSLCKKQLEKAGREVHLVNEVQQSAFIRRAWTEVMMGSTLFTYEQARIFIETVKSQNSPFLDSPDQDPRVAIYFRYQELLKQIGAMDFSDMLVETVKGMESGSVAPLDVSWMLADEFQDCDRVQLAWLLMHMRKGREITVVGDDDQCVYSWRNALGYKGMSEFRQASGAAEVKLNTTYRCPQEVIVPASRLIAVNQERVQKSLRTENLGRGSVKKVMAKDRADEIELVVQAVLESGRPGDWGILSRTNRMLDQIEQQIADRFPVSRTSGKSFWDLRHPATFIALCRSIGYDEMVGVDQVLRMAGVTERRLSQIHSKYSSRDRGSLTKYLTDGGESPVEDRFCGMARQWRQLLSQGQVVLGIQGIAGYMKRNLQLVDPGTKNKDEATTKAGELIDAGARILGQLKGGLGARIRLVERPKEDASEAMEPDEELGEGTARLMTLHGSKGLEFQNVWMIGCEAGVIPAKGSPVEEERRLFYVGMTRAKRTLYMSYSDGPPSQFMTECGIV